MRLKRIHLKNFQAHEDLAIDLDPGITTLVGQTDRGKSAVLRALEWVLLNSIRGEGFIKDGEKSAEVVVTFVDKRMGRKVRRKRGGENIYALDGEVFRAFGQGVVPQDIQAALRVDAINFQGQHDPPFWLSLSAGEVSRRLNSIVDLSAIDDAVAKIAASVREANATKQVVVARLAEAEKRLEELGKQKPRVLAFRRLQGLRLDLESTLHEAGCYRETIEAQERADAKEAKARALHSLAFRAEAVHVTTSRITRLKASLASHGRVSKVKAPPDFSKIELLFASWQDICGRRDLLSDYVESAGDAALASADADLKARQAEEEFHAQTKGKPCPLCGAIQS